MCSARGKPRPSRETGRAARCMVSGVSSAGSVSRKCVKVSSMTASWDLAAGAVIAGGQVRKRLRGMLERLLRRKREPICGESNCRRERASERTVSFLGVGAGSLVKEVGGE